MGELIRVETAPMSAEMALNAMGQQLMDMAMLLRATNERMGALEREVRRLTKVTPSQASMLTAAIRQRAKEICLIHRCKGGEYAAGRAIRKGIYATLGVTNVRDVPRDDFKVAMRAIELWDDYQEMKRIREKVNAHG